MKVSVIIPTNDRNEFLRNTLQSVLNQTRYDAIEQIIVSENGITDSSREICAQFENEKIVYVKQETPKKFLEHIQWLINKPTTDLCAMLHDDDWWYPNYLEESIKTFKKDDDVCCYTNFLFAKDPNLGKSSFHYITILSQFIKANSLLNTVRFTKDDILTLCYLYTPFHMSGMLCKTEVLKNAYNTVMPFQRAFYIDRILYPFIALQGNTNFVNQINVGIRLHPVTVSNSLKEEEKLNDHVAGSEIIKKLGSDNGIDIISNWKKLSEKISPEDWNEIQFAFDFYFRQFSPFKRTEDRKYGIKAQVKKILGR